MRVTRGNQSAKYSTTGERSDGPLFGGAGKRSLVEADWAEAPGDAPKGASPGASASAARNAPPGAPALPARRAVALGRLGGRLVALAQPPPTMRLPPAGGVL